MAIGYEMSLQDYLRVVVKRKWIILICTFTIFVTSIVYTSKLVPRYATSCRVELSYQSTLASLLADALLYNGNELATAIQFATSLPVMERAAKDMRIVRDKDKKEIPPGHPEYKATLRAAVGRLQAGASAAGDGQTNFITISFVGEDPEFCAAACDGIAAAYAKEYRNRNTSEAEQVRLFIEEQMKKAEVELLRAENMLLQFKQKRDYVELEPGVRVTIEHASTLDAEYEKVKAERAQVQRDLDAAMQEVREEEPSQESKDYINMDPGMVSLKKQLVDAEVNLAVKLRDLTPRHPEVRIAEENIRKLRTQLEVSIAELFSGRTAQLQGRLETLKAREAALERALPQLRFAMDEVPRDQLEQARIQRLITMQEKLYSFFRDKLEEKRYDELVKKDNSISVVERANVPSVPIYPNKTANSLVGMTIGLMLGFALAFVVESMDTSIGTIEDVERTTGMSVLGVIPSIAVEDEEALQSERAVVTFDPDRVRTRDIRDRLSELDNAVRQSGAGMGAYRPQLITYFDPKSPISEAYRTLRTNVQFKGFLGNSRTLTVTSSGPQEGKTTTLCNLAVTMAQSGQKVLAIGCNLRRPALHKMFGIKKKPGVTDVLIGQRDWREVVQETGIDNLHAFCSGPIPPNPSELLASPEMTEMIRQVRDAYDVVIFDCPPVLPVTDAAVLSSKVDCVLMVYYVNRAAREALLRAKVQLENVGAKILGVVLNHIPAEGRLGYSYYYYHYHYYGESSKDESGARILKKKSS